MDKVGDIIVLFCQCVIKFYFDSVNFMHNQQKTKAAKNDEIPLFNKQQVQTNTESPRLSFK